MVRSFMSASPPLTHHFAALAPEYDIALCDVWGVVHNGIAATPEACDALTRYRRQGGTVVLITNAPRPADVVKDFIDRLNVPTDAYDGIVSSGDVTRTVVARHAGQNVFHLGPDRDLPIYDGLDIRVTPIERADFVVCSGLFDDTVETPQDYLGLIATMRARNLSMVCANPDIVVGRGDDLVYCAGAIADLYTTHGGDVLYAGKPHRPIYEQALAMAERISGRQAVRDRVLAIGDSIHTDLQGATRFGLDCLFVTAGIHAEELGGNEAPNATALGNIFAAAGVYPRAVMRRLEW
jgi:HAD superfamily hydrolase (TIGR01459 family)